MKLDLGKFNPFRKLERLEVYLLAAENPLGHRQYRPIFRRKRNREVLTREQVTAIKRGRRVLRREMKEQGLKRRIDFEVTATNLGLFFDRNRFLWPFFLWLIRDHTVAKILATTAVLTTVLTITEPVIEYVIQYVTQYVTQYVDRLVDRIVTEYIDREVNRFTIDLSEGLYNSGFSLAEEPGFSEPSTYLICDPVEGVPCMSIADIPQSVAEEVGGEHHDIYFAYTFYARYEVTDMDTSNADPIDYHWEIKLNRETKDLSKAVWLMVIQSDVTEGDAGDGNVITQVQTENGGIITYVENNKQMSFHAEVGADGDNEALPSREITDVAYEGPLPLQELAKDPAQYELMHEGRYYNYYRVVPINFVSETVAAEGVKTNVYPNDVQRYTVVIWLEGDDPECTDEMIGAQIGMNFQIQLEEEYQQGGGSFDIVTGETGSTEETEAA